MAQMPKGQPRSVPDPAGDRYDAMIREENLKKQRAELAAMSGASPRLSRFDWRIEDLDLAPRRGRTVTIGRQTYREVDNGSANVLVPVANSSITPEVYAAQQQALRQAARMAQSPFGAIAYGIVGGASAPQPVGEVAMSAGELVDGLGAGRAVRTGPVRRQPALWRGQVAPPSTPRDPVRTRPLNGAGQATGVSATLTAPMLGTGTKANRRYSPPGWRSGQAPYFDNRAHLLARQLGGDGKDPRNLVTAARQTNHPRMSQFERGVASRVRAGEVVEYSATPLYDGVGAPSALFLTASGSRGAPTARLIQNPVGQRR